jgi:hypothetical protein
MQHLAQPTVLKSAAVAALLTSVAGYPRLALWPTPYVTWYLELVLFTGSFVLWAFVFAWHPPFTGRSVFVRPADRRLWLRVTTVGVVVALALLGLLDPTFRARTPADYPVSLRQWWAMTAFALAFQPLFLTFAPLDWAARLLRRTWLAVAFTILFGVVVMIIKTRSAPTPLPTTVFLELLGLRVVLGAVAVYCYLRGGVFLVWWWTLLLQLRHLWSLADSVNS